MRQYSRRYSRYCVRHIQNLRCDDLVLGCDQAAHIWAEVSLLVSVKGTRQRYRSQNRQPFLATRPNEVWGYDFVFDAFAKGQKIK